MIIGAFFLGLMFGSVIGWVTCALMVHAGRESDRLDAERIARLQPPHFAREDASAWREDDFT